MITAALVVLASVETCGAAILLAQPCVSTYNSCINTCDSNYKCTTTSVSCLIAWDQCRSKCFSDEMSCLQRPHTTPQTPGCNACSTDASEPQCLVPYMSGVGTPVASSVQCFPNGANTVVTGDADYMIGNNPGALTRVSKTPYTFVYTSGKFWTGSQARGGGRKVSVTVQNKLSCGFWVDIQIVKYYSEFVLSACSARGLRSGGYYDVVGGSSRIVVQAN